MASKKEYEMTFALNAQMGSGFSSTFSSANSHVAALQCEIMELNSTQGDIAAYQKQQEAVGATQKKLEMLQQQYDNIQREIQETEGYSSSLNNALLAKQAQIDKTSSSLEKQTQKLDGMGQALSEAGVDTNNLTAESKRLEAEMKQLKDKQVEAAESAETFGDKATQAVEGLSSALAAAGAAKMVKEIGIAFLDCSELAADFEQEMSGIQAITNADADEMAVLADKAKEMGAVTKFTAKEAATGLSIFAMAGLSVEEQLAAINPALDFASAGILSLDQSVSIITGSVKGFKDSMDNAAYYTDMIAMGASIANTNVANLGEAFSGSAATASGYGQSAEEVSVALLRLAEQNITGSSAATMFARTLADLYAPTDDAKSALEELGVAAYDLHGNARPVNAVIDDLAVALDGYTEQEQNAYKSTIFTAQGLSGFSKMCVSSKDKVESFYKSLENSGGAAARQAEIQLDNLNGDLTLMNSAMDAVKVTVGEEVNPTFRDLTKIATEALTDVNEFIKRNPGLVKGLGATVAILGGAVTAVTSLAAAMKLVKALNVAALFTGPTGAVLAGAAAVAALTGGIIYMMEQTNDAVPKMKDITEASSAMNKTIAECEQAYSDTAAETQATANLADMYIGELERLEASGLKTADSQRQYHNTLLLLTQLVPELSDQIDLETDTIEGGTAALRRNTEAWAENARQQAYQQYLTELQSKYADVLIEQEKNTIKLSEAEQQYEAAETKKAVAQRRMNVLWEEAEAAADEYNRATGELTSASTYLTDEYYQLEAVVKEADDTMAVAEMSASRYSQAIKNDSESVAAAEAEIALAQEAVNGLTGALDGSSDAAAQNADMIASVNAAIDGTFEQVQKLTEAYQEAYTAAQESIGGQYDIWDEAAEVAAVKASTINENLQGQITYWQDYNSNLESLRGRAGDIEGLQEVIASFADGSAESVNAIAGMAAASDSELKDMVTNYQALQTEQSTVSQSVADMVTNYSAQMDTLKNNVAADIQGMNLSAEATAAAISTMDSYINAAKAQLPRVEAAYRAIGNAAAAAMRSASAGSIQMSNVPKYASGTTSAESGYAIVGENGPELVYFGGGEQVVNAHQTEALMERASAQSMTRAELQASYPVSENSGAGQSAEKTEINVSFMIEGNASENTVSRLREYGDEFAQRVLDVLENLERDRGRMAYA